MRSFARQLTSDPGSLSNQAAIKKVTEYLSFRDTSSDDVSQPSEDPLFELFQDMADPDETTFQPQKMAQSNEPPVLQAEDGANKAPKTQRCEIYSVLGFQADAFVVIWHGTGSTTLPTPGCIGMSLLK